jgi:hypothetical protein
MLLCGCNYLFTKISCFYTSEKGEWEHFVGGKYISSAVVDRKYLFSDEENQVLFPGWHTNNLDHHEAHKKTHRSEKLIPSMFHMCITNPSSPHNVEQPVRFECCSPTWSYGHQIKRVFLQVANQSTRLNFNS